VSDLLCIHDSTQILHSSLFDFPPFNVDTGVKFSMQSVQSFALQQRSRHTTLIIHARKDNNMVRQIVPMTDHLVCWNSMAKRSDGEMMNPGAY
jgi:hypothetical protein